MYTFSFRKILIFSLLGVCCAFFGLSFWLSKTPLLVDASVVVAEANCAPNGAQIEGLVASRIERKGNAGTFYEIKNCGNNKHSTYADMYRGTCKGQTGNCYPTEHWAQFTPEMDPGEYFTFQIDSPTISCGSAQTDIHPAGLPTAGFYYNSPNGSCVEKTPTPKPTATFTPTPKPTATNTPTFTPTKTPTPTYTSTPTATLTPTQRPTASLSPTFTSTPSVSATLTPTVSATLTPTVQSTPTPTPPPTTELKLCKYEDDNGNGEYDSGEDVLSWTFSYEYEGQKYTADSHWWHFWTQGCLIVSVPTGKSITVGEEQKGGWRPTAIFADGQKQTDITSYTYTSVSDAVKIIWFLNTFTPTVPTSTPTISASPTITPTPSVTSTPTLTPSITVTQTPTTTVTPTIPPSEITQLKICKYDDKNANGEVDNGEGTISWKFTYTIDTGTPIVVERNIWDELIHQGCVIVDVPSVRSIAISEEIKPEWVQTALFADGIKVSGPSYVYTSTAEQIKVLWFLNNHTTILTPTLTPTGSLTPTNTPTLTLTPTVTPTQVPSCSNLALSPSVGSAPLTVAATGYGNDPYGSVEEYEFNFGDTSNNQQQIITQSGNQATHVYNNSGTYTVSLRIKDSSGNWRDGNPDCRRDITVQSQPQVLGASTTNTLPATGVGVLAFGAVGLLGTGGWIVRRLYRMI